MKRVKNMQITHKTFGLEKERREHSNSTEDPKHTIEAWNFSVWDNCDIWHEVPNLRRKTLYYFSCHRIEWEAKEENESASRAKEKMPISWSDWGKIFIPDLINVKQMEQRLYPRSHQQTMWHWLSYFGMHTKDRLCLIVALFIGSHVKYTNPQEVLAYILYQTTRAWRLKEENMFVVSVPLFISGSRGIVPR